ncbi:MAG: hypothetical protein DA405_02170 [Bacteroidetes bacterium]|nr:MAG: hypothetical protein DA405_02170 [Bacteroidota bacterium]
MPLTRLYQKPVSLFLFVLFISTLSSSLLAQAKTVVDPSYWLVAHTEFKFTNRWSSFVELEERRFISPERALQRSLPLLGLKYKASDRFSFEVDYLNFKIFLPQIANTDINAHVLEQRFSFAASFTFGKRRRFSLRLKDEYRLFDITPDDGKLEFKRAINRLRIRLAHQLPLKADWTLNSSAELLLNYAAKTSIKTFDQSRFYLGFKYQLSPSHSLEVGYLNWYQESRTMALFFNRHIVRLGWVYTLDFRPTNQT